MNDLSWHKLSKFLLPRKTAEKFHSYFSFMSILDK